jgi:hypothetical protein
VFEAETAAGHREHSTMAGTVALGYASATASVWCLLLVGRACCAAGVSMWCMLLVVLVPPAVPCPLAIRALSARPGAQRWQLTLGACSVPAPPAGRCRHRHRRRCRPASSSACSATATEAERVRGRSPLLTVEACCFSVAGSTG